MSTENLRSVIAPQLLHSIFNLSVPLPKDVPPSGRDWHVHNSKADQASWSLLCKEPLTLLSKLDSIAASDLMHLLPDVQDHDFPVQALGLIILLDQAPRHICNGVNERWRSGFFDPLVLSLRQKIAELPIELRLEGQRRWVEDLGFTFAHWCIVQTYLVAPYAHCEDIRIHESAMLPMVQELRSQTEKHYGVKDETYANELESGALMAESMDVFAFSRIARGGWPQTESISDRIFHFCRLLDAHEPLLRKFGRYPYRNGALGRSNTEEEEAFLSQTSGFGTSVTSADATKIRDDIERKLWTPLDW